MVGRVSGFLKVSGEMNFRGGVQDSLSTLVSARAGVGGLVWQPILAKSTTQKASVKSVRENFIGSRCFDAPNGAAQSSENFVIGIFFPTEFYLAKSIPFDAAFG